MKNIPYDDFTDSLFSYISDYHLELIETANYYGMEALTENEQLLIQGITYERFAQLQGYL